MPKNKLFPKQAKSELQADESSFYSILNECPFLVWISDSNGLCTFVNTAWLNFTGKTLEQELGLGWSESVHPEDLDFCFRIYKTVLEQRQKFQMEYRLRRWNGEYGWIFDEGRPRFNPDGSFVGYIGTCIDISDRIQAKQEREQLLQQIVQDRQFLTTVLQQMPVGVVIAQPPSGEIILSNDNAASILKHPLKPITKIEDYAQYGCLQSDGTPTKAEDYSIVKALQGKETPGKEVDFLCGDGIIRPLFINAAPIRNQQSEVIAAIATFYDLTEIKQGQAAKKEAENKSILLKEIHHRLKNNLQIVSSLLDLQSTQIKDTEANLLLEKSQTRIQTMALIHEKLYTSASLDQINFAEYVNFLTKYLYDSFIQDIKEIKLNLDIESTYLNLDLATPCGLIINELVVNSLQHAFVDQSTGEIKISFHKFAESYCLIIQDNGSGIPEGIDLGENTQFLGLSLVNSLVKEQLKGTFVIERDLVAYASGNRGSRFTITFPIN
ncbi:MAG: histidine kinase dimerization/phosphoacceptor domain -containing protein [Waterburya sp.]